MPAAARARIEVRPVEDADRRIAPAAQPHELRLVARNGAVIARSEPHPSRRHALRGCDAWVRAMGDVLHIGALGVTWPPERPRVVVEEA